MLPPPIETDAFKYPGEIRFRQPHDARNLSTYKSLEHRTFGLPLLDYERDLSALTWLAGGSPRHPDWRCWTESVLWDFEELALGHDYREEGIEDHWRSLRSLGKVRTGLRKNPDQPGWYEGFGKMINLPDFQRPMPGYGWQQTTFPGVEFLSRWVDISDYPVALQPHLLFSIVSTWGTYEPHPGVQNIRKRLRSFLEPMTAKDIEDLDELKFADSVAWDNALDDQERVRASIRKRKSRLA
jgi:hypothetical protein